MNHGWTFADAANYELAIDATEQTLEIRIMGRIGSHYGVFDCDAHAVLHQTRHSVESGFFVRAKVVLVFQIKNQSGIGSLGNFSVTAVQTGGIAWIAARQNHCAGES